MNGQSIDIVVIYEELEHSVRLFGGVDVLKTLILTFQQGKQRHRHHKLNAIFVPTYISNLPRDTYYGLPRSRDTH